MEPKVRPDVVTELATLVGYYTCKHMQDIEDIAYEFAIRATEKETDLVSDIIEHALKGNIAQTIETILKNQTKEN